MSSVPHQPFFRTLKSTQPQTHQNTIKPLQNHVKPPYNHLTYFKITSTSQNTKQKQHILSFFKSHKKNKTHTQKNKLPTSQPNSQPNSHPQVSAWHVRPLTAQQLDYAAQDAHVCVRLFDSPLGLVGLGWFGMFWG